MRSYNEVSLLFCVTQEEPLWRSSHRSVSDHICRQALKRALQHCGPFIFPLHWQAHCRSTTRWLFDGQYDLTFWTCKTSTFQSIEGCSSHNKATNVFRTSLARSTSRWCPSLCDFRCKPCTCKTAPLLGDTKRAAARHPSLLDGINPSRILVARPLSWPASGPWESPRCVESPVRTLNRGSEPAPLTSRLLLKY